MGRHRLKKTKWTKNKVHEVNPDYLDPQVEGDGADTEFEGAFRDIQLSFRGKRVSSELQEALFDSNEMMECMPSGLKTGDEIRSKYGNKVPFHIRSLSCYKNVYDVFVCFAKALKLEKVELSFPNKIHDSSRYCYLISETLLNLPALMVLGKDRESFKLDIINALKEEACYCNTEQQKSTNREALEMLDGSVGKLMFEGAERSGGRGT